MLFGTATNLINITSNIVLIKNNVIMMFMQSEKKNEKSQQFRRKNEM